MGVKVYQNTVQDYQNAELKDSELPAKIEIYNSFGSLLKDFKLTEAVQQINIEVMTPGFTYTG